MLIACPNSDNYQVILSEQTWTTQVCITPIIPLEWECRWKSPSIQYLNSLENSNRINEEKLQGTRLGLTWLKLFLTIGTFQKQKGLSWVVVSALSLVLFI